MTETITYNDYLRLQGLFKLAEQWNRSIRHCEQAAAEILGVPESYGSYDYVSDVIWGVDSPDVDQMLRHMGVEVEAANV